MNKQIKKLWDKHLKIRYPRNNKIKKINGIILADLFRVTNDNISAYMKTSESDLNLESQLKLERCLNELNAIIPELSSDALIFTKRLVELCKLVLNYSETKFPARLHVLIARNANNAIVIRRGPSKHVCTFEWDRKKDTYILGQWLKKARVFERRSDISANGKYWIYFALNGKWQSKSHGSWTAIAKTPWLKALTMYAKGDGWHGGGLFSFDNNYWLNDGYGHKKLFNSPLVKRNNNYQPLNDYGGECLNVYYNRLQRDGWNLKKHEILSKWNEQAIFERQLSHDWILRKVCHEQINSPIGKGCYWDEHELQNRNGEILTFTEWEWAEWADGVIYYAEKGRLYQQSIKNSTTINNLKLLHDFNEYKFEERQAPY